MRKLLIADDEPKIRRGLSRCLDWGKLGLEVVGLAQDGKEAIEMAKNLKPDFMFVDICMPFINGLELIEMINRQLPECLIYIISGHDEFRYAQRAIQLNVVDYIVKPVDEEELEEAVKNGIRQIERVEKSRKEHAWSKGQIEKNRDILRDGFLQNWISGRITEEEFFTEMRHLKIEMDQYEGIIIVKPRENLKITSKTEKKEANIFISVKTILQEAIGDNILKLFFQDERENIVVFTERMTSAYWFEIIVKLEEIIESNLSYKTIVHGERIEEGVSEFPKIYEKILREIESNRKETPIVQRARKYIHQYYYKQELTLDEVANYVGANPSYLTRMIKREIGVSFSVYLTKVRVRNAMVFLKESDLKMYEIAEKVGYNTQHYFSAAFKKVTGVSPISFKNKRGRVE